MITFWPQAHRCHGAGCGVRALRSQDLSAYHRDMMRYAALALFLVTLAQPAGAQEWWRGYKNTLENLRPLAERGDAKAQNNLGMMYHFGQGAPKDFQKAVNWYRRAIKQGDTLAPINLSVLVKKLRAQGIWTPRLSNSATFNEGIVAFDRGDFATAFKHWRPLAKRGMVEAQHNLGNMYRHSKGVPQNFADAYRWYLKAAKQGHAASMLSLGEMIYQGQGLPQNFSKAVEWYRKSANRGFAAAQAKLGAMYQMGRGVPQDNLLAYVWFNIAAANGSRPAEKFRGYVSEQLSPAALHKAQAMARNWRPRLAQETPNSSVVAKATEKKRKPRIAVQSVSGSGFFVSNMGHVVTNAHVVKRCQRITAGVSKNRQIPTDLLETDIRNDLALLKLSSLGVGSVEPNSLIDKLGLKVVPVSENGLLRSEDVELGESVMVAGFPFGDIFSNTIKVTLGIVSSVRGFGNDASRFQIDAAVQSGNSGGPIYDQNGNIVGVVIAQLSKIKVAKTIGSLPENVNFGIKSSTVRQFLIASGLPANLSKRSEGLSTKQLAKIAQKQTLMVICHR